MFSGSKLRNSRKEREHAFGVADSVTSKVLPSFDATVGAAQRTKTTTASCLITEENSVVVADELGFFDVNSGEVSDSDQGDRQGEPLSEVRRVIQAVESEAKSGETGRAKAVERTTRRSVAAIDGETPSSMIPSLAVTQRQPHGQSGCAEDGEYSKGGNDSSDEVVEDGTKTSSTADDTASPPEVKSTSGQAMV